MDVSCLPPPVAEVCVLVRGALLAWLARTAQGGEEGAWYGYIVLKKNKTKAKPSESLEIKKLSLLNVRVD